MVTDDLGWTILAVSVGRGDACGKPLRQVHCPTLALPQLSVRILWRQGWQLTRTVQWVQSRYEELLSQTGAWPGVTAPTQGRS